MQFHQDIPKDCPPSDAAPISNTVLRAAEGQILKDDDLLSACELGNTMCKPSKCQCWGLSVWPSKEAAIHARKILPHFRLRYIHSITLDATAGVMMPTPSKKQPNHYTWWKSQDFVFEGPTEIALSPENS